MTKLRTPDTVEGALDRAVGLVGADQVGRWIGKSASWIRKASDPDDTARHLAFVDGLEIDRQLVRHGLDPVFSEVAAESARAIRAQFVLAPVSTGDEESPLSAAVHVVGRASNLLEQVQAAESDGRVDPRELSALLAGIERLQKQIPKLRRSLFARQQTPARRTK